ncbi:DNA cytosine methyltransferase [Micromonospora sp. CA-240977]|uniref:DNA cytosine methyltransferase n=1 Tax=Micromonospora sp. CA-240977 TaxID=3239957 RepID=UPI003D9297C7
MTCDDWRFVSLFSGAGGLDAGLEAAGWIPIAQVEMDKDAVGTLELAARRREKTEGAVETKIYPERIEDISPQKIREELHLDRGELPLMAGGPPCQPFTTHGLRLSISDARASGVWPAYLTYVDEFLPKALLIENVDGLLSAALRHRPLNRRGKGHDALALEEQKGSFLLWLVRELVSRGYTLTWGVAEAADYGVPQLRQRSIIIGVRSDRPCFLPPRQFGGDGQKPYRTLKDALASLESLGAVQPLSERKRRVYENVPPGGNWRNLPAEMQRETMGAAHVATGGKSGWWRRLAWDQPAPTILGMPDHSSTALIHPAEVRCLSVLECAAAQSFPPGYEVAGNPRSQYQQIGNAVPPLLGEAVGGQLRRYFLGEPQVEPEEPAWRKTSANRRIGTHGWVTAGPGKAPSLTLKVKVRPDHVWSHVAENFLA